MKKTIVNIAPAVAETPRTKRVAAYARVSCGKDTMLHSLAAQIDYYRDYIMMNPEWRFAGVYADESKTGTKDNREQFQLLLTECRSGKEKTQPVGSKSSFTGKIRCSCCGKNYRRKTTPYNIVWCCSTYNSKGKKYCPDSKVIPEETLKRAAAEILKTDGFSDGAFETQICTIEAHPGNLLRFIFTDDSTTDYVWKDRSRSESWTDEMKAAAGRKTKERDANHGK